VDHNLIADTLHIEPRPGCAKRTEANRDPEDAVDMRANRKNRANSIVKRKRRRASHRSRCRLLRATGKTNSAASREGCSALEEGTTIHRASPEEVSLVSFSNGEELERLKTVIEENALRKKKVWSRCIEMHTNSRPTQNNTPSDLLCA
jgi:hypothetical protein